MINATIFIDTGKINPSTGFVVENWLQADMSTASIVLKDSIKKAKDTGKVFTVYTNPFTLPASKNNNIIFKRFNNNRVYEGFDPRRKYSALIKVNGIDYKKGYIRLNKVNVEHNMPVSYSIQFFGEISSLKDVLGDKKLRDLWNLSRLNFEYNAPNVHMGFETGLDVENQGQVGRKQVDIFTIERGSLISGNFTLTLDGNPYVIAMPAKLNLVDARDFLMDFINETLYNDFVATAITNNQVLLRIESKEVGTVTPATFNAGSTGVDGFIYTEVFGTFDNVDYTSNVCVPNQRGAIKFPLISHTRGFEYTDQYGFHRMREPAEYGRNGEEDVIPESDWRLNIYDIKPALKVSKIFEAIEVQFPTLNFDTKWLFGQDITNGFQGGRSGMEKSPIDEMYMWLHNKKGYVGQTNDNGDSLDFTWTRTFNIEGADQNTDIREWNYDLAGSSNRADIRPMESHNNYTDARAYSGNVIIEDVVGSGDIKVVIQVMDKLTGLKFTGNNSTFSASFSSADEEKIANFQFPYDFEGIQKPVELSSNTGEYYIVTTITCDSDIIKFTPRLEMEMYKFQYFEGGDFPPFDGYMFITTGTRYMTTGEGPVEVVKSINPQELVPDYKIIDFLKDLFKMYNLVAFEEVQIDNSYKINIMSYDNYISIGNILDITKYVDISKGSVERVAPYSSIEYKFEDPDTFLAVNQKEITGDDFGNANFDVNNFNEGVNSSASLLFDGGKYKVELGLDKMMYERLSSVPNKEETNIQFGWHVNDNKENVPEPTIGGPLYMFPVQENIDEFTIVWDDGYFTESYHRPSNVSSDGSQTLHFNNEFDEWTKLLNPNSLFQNFHSKYISGIYSPFAKKIKIKCHFPPLVLSNIELNDTVVVDTVSYFIETMDLNIINGEAKLTLLRVTDIQTRLSGGGDDIGGDESIWDTTNTNWEDETLNPL